MPLVKVLNEAQIYPDDSPQYHVYTLFTIFVYIYILKKKTLIQSYAHTLQYVVFHYVTLNYLTLHCITLYILYIYITFTVTTFIIIRNNVYVNALKHHPDLLWPKPSSPSCTTGGPSKLSQVKSSWSSSSLRSAAVRLLAIIELTNRVNIISTMKLYMICDH